MEVIVIGFIVILVLGALFGGESFGGVIGTGVVVAIIISVAFSVYAKYETSQQDEEYEKQQQQSNREE